jgi:hypothetical protein
MRKSLITKAGVLATLALILPTLALASAQAASVTVTSHFVWTPTSSSLDGDSTFIANGATNAAPHDLLFITPNLTPGGISPCPCLVEEQKPFGVWYDSSRGRWAIFNEDGSTMNQLRSFNVLVVPKAGKSVFVVRAKSSNTIGNRTLINSPLTNARPGAVIQVTQDFNPGNSGGSFNDHQVGARYFPALKRWGIFNEDGAAIAAGVAFNVLVGQSPSNGGKTMVLKVTSANRHNSLANISNQETTGNPNNVVLITQDFNPRGKGGAGDSSPTDVGYRAPKEFVLNWNAPAQLGTAFNLLIFSS